jgi:hypothetical protein
MTQYHMDEAVFDLSAEWTDESLHALWRPIEGTTDRVAITITRESATERELPALLERSLQKYRTNMRHFEVLQRNDDFEVAGLAAARVRFQWRNEHGPIYHQHVLLVLHGRLLTFTATGKWQHRARCDEELARVLSTVTFREQRL